MTRPSPHSILMPALVLLLSLGVLAFTVGEGSRHLRRVLRGQMVDRDGEILYAVAQSRLFSEPATNLTRRLQDTVEQLALALDISQLKEGVIGVRLFDKKGKFVIPFPETIKDSLLSAKELADLQALKPSSHYEDSASLANVLLMRTPDEFSATNVLPLLEVNIPIHEPGKTEYLGSAQLILDAHDIQRQSARLDHQLELQALGEFLAGGGLLTTALVWAYRRLQKVNNLLAERTARLLRANHELTLAAKTGALGAVTAHLIHGLSNPLANLQDFIAAKGGLTSPDDDWQDAVAATRRMQQLVHEVVRVLGEEAGSDRYQLSLLELSAILKAKIKPLARDFGVDCVFNVATTRSIANHQANVLLLILENLIHNALKVTARGKQVTVSIADLDQDVLFEVSDQGAGFPDVFVKNPFMPCRSTQGGAGLGLAISNRLSTHLGAVLALTDSGPSGSLLRLLLPAAALVREEPVGPLDGIRV